MSPTIALEFDDSVDPSWRVAIDHAFRVWAAARRVAVVDPRWAPGARLRYGGPDSDLPVTTMTTPAPRSAAGLPWYFGGEQPDHLAEIHAWVGALSEADGARDELGRVDRSASMASTLDVDPAVPWAERHLDAFDSIVLRTRPELAPALEAARATPLTVLGSHDIDFLPLRHRDVADRVGRNLAVAALVRRDLRAVALIAGSAAANLARRRPILGGVDTVREIEGRHGVRSTWNVIVRRRHERDANYDFDDPTVRRVLDELAGEGHEIGLHASYTSATTPGAVADEMALLREAGYPAVGTRQHWLRHPGADLFRELAKAGAGYDSSFGWSDACGFRHGMARPFVPFDTSTGAPAEVLEVPLVVMDVALADRDPGGPGDADLADAILREADLVGGAVSVLWHDTTLANTQLRTGVGPLYEWLLARGDRWATTAETVAHLRPAWRAAGLAVT